MEPAKVTYTYDVKVPKILIEDNGDKVSLLHCHPAYSFEELTVSSSEKLFEIIQIVAFCHGSIKYQYLRQSVNNRGRYLVGSFSAAVAEDKTVVDLCRTILKQKVIE